MFADLRAIAADLDGQPEFARFRPTLEKAVLTQSCATDLARAQTCCDALDELLPSPRKRGTLTRGATEGALLQTAVLLYERATAAPAKRQERGSIALVDHFSEEAKEDHLALVKVRHRAIAHVYADEAIDGETWSKGLLFAVETDGAWQVASATRSVQFDAPTFARLKRQIPLARSIMEKRFQDLIARLVGMLNSASLPSDLFVRNQFDPKEEFGGSEALRRVLEGQLTGRASFNTN